MGASASTDGHDVSIFPANGANTPVEIFESDTPLVVEERASRLTREARAK